MDKEGSVRFKRVKIFAKYVHGEKAVSKRIHQWWFIPRAARAWNIGGELLAGNSVEPAECKSELIMHHEKDGKESQNRAENK